MSGRHRSLPRPGTQGEHALLSRDGKGYGGFDFGQHIISSQRSLGRKGSIERSDDGCLDFGTRIAGACPNEPFELVF